jgi:hypothetical protein
LKIRFIKWAIDSIRSFGSSQIDLLAAEKEISGRYITSIDSVCWPVVWLSAWLPATYPALTE